MTQPALFRQITQVAMVVKDVEATAKRYWDDVGVGPWKFYTIDRSNTGSMMLQGKPVEHAFRAAKAHLKSKGYSETQSERSFNMAAMHILILIKVLVA